MTADERLNRIRAKVDRANQHIRNLEGGLRDLRQAEPYKIGAKRDPQTGQLNIHVLNVPTIPSVASAITGDALQNMRSALDHLAYELWLLGPAGGKGGPAKHVYFPIAEDATKYKAEAPGKVQGMRKEAIKAIDAIKPYGTGNRNTPGDTLWRLHYLNIVDKHRALMLVGSAFRSLNFSPVLEAAWPDDPKRPKPALPPFFLRPMNRQFPLKVGDVLFSHAPNEEVAQKMEFRFEEAFGEPGIAEGEPLLETLQGMADLVDHLIADFRPLLS